jgi:hypothetical protein
MIPKSRACAAVRVFGPLILALVSCARPAPPVPAETAAPRTASAACVDGHGVWHAPNPAWTPGATCSRDDPDFDEERYPARVAHCRRHITEAEKARVAERYGIPREDWHLYEFDHFVSLNAGGSNADENLWPQPIDDAKEKDIVEDEVYNGLRRGTLTQAEGVEKIRSWRPSSCRER